MVFSYLMQTISSVAKLGDKFSCGLCLFLQLMWQHLDSKDLIRLELGQIKKKPTLILNAKCSQRNSWQGWWSWDILMWWKLSSGAFRIMIMGLSIMYETFFHVSVEIYCIVLFCGVKLNICQSRLLTNNGQVWERL